ncbi:Alpha/beta hydrolase [Rubrivivax sp. A210]|uniref:alpha/beta fold hydrolase n=1 Tax=Rubrivivax sp. A210 TaxID=2772301 RepID=UPI00191837CA|nr:alpha/beta fold hydrolase [Rubrivivax sp. A210]CAD5366376.1 Alpha/beta hydrolase [Rubrivivax sp. A210]
MKVSANGLAFEVDDQGLPAGEPLLLIMGLGMQLVGWPDELVQALVSRGFRVLRMDNRDAGLSQGFDHLGKPSLGWAATRYALHLPVAAPYGIADMATDALGVLDALGLESAHICGASMGGMIAQHLAARHPRRVRSLTLMMTTSGARRLPQPSMRVRGVLMSRPDGRDHEAIARHLRHVMGVIGSPAYPADPALMRARLQETVARAWRPAGTARQLMAVLADGDRSALLPLIQAPTQIIHGEADPLVLPAAGRELAALIKGARLDMVPGMGHDLPQQLLPRFADGIAAVAARA